MAEIVFLTPQQAPAARVMIYTVAHLVFPSGRTLEEDIALYSEEWPLHDLDDLPGRYFNNGGTFLAAMDGEKIAGTGGIWRLEDGVCELKRFWFLPEYHGTGMAAALLGRLMEIARGMGYHTMRLETSAEGQERAVAFYKKHGFVSIPSYGGDPGEIAMERRLEG
jgi:putative acetyltransferase